MQTIIRHAVLYAVAALAAASAQPLYAQAVDIEAMKRSLESQIELYRQVNDHESRIRALEQQVGASSRDVTAGAVAKDAERTAAPVSDSRPVLDMLTADGEWCINCNWWKERGDQGLPFRLNLVVSKEQPRYGWPTFRVPVAADGREWFIGNPESSEAGAKALVSMWRKITGSSTPPAAAAQAPTPYTKIAEGLEIAGLEPGQTFADIGCGDGRALMIATEQFGSSKATGVELDVNQVALSRKRLAAAGLSDRTEVIAGDATKIDLPTADVGYVYLYPETLEVLRDKLTSNYGTVVSYIHEIPGLKMQKRGDFYVWKAGQSVASEPQEAKQPAMRMVTQYQLQKVYVPPWQTPGRECGNRACVMCYGGYQMRQVPVQVAVKQQQAAVPQRQVRYCRSCGR